jgi:hypothetical protein
VVLTYSSWRDFVLRLKTFLREHTSKSTGAAAPLLPLEGGEHRASRRATARRSPTGTRIRSAKRR